MRFVTQCHRCELHNVLCVLRNIQRVLRNTQGRLHNILGVLHNVHGILGNALFSHRNANSIMGWGTERNKKQEIKKLTEN